MTPGGMWKIARSTYESFSKDDAMSLAAAVAFYTALSFAPLVLLLVTVGGFLGEASQNNLVGFLNSQIGPRAGEVTAAVVENAEAQGEAKNTGRWVISTAVLIFTASAVFAQLQTSLNRIWGTTAKPRRAWWVWLRRRLLSLGMVIVILFILLVAMVLSSVLQRFIPEDRGVWARLGMELVSFVVAALLFAAIFKVLPDVRIAWRDVWLGAAITAALFSVGKFAVSVYMDRGGVGESYGSAAGALIALLVWVYYSCVILFLGAEITQVVAKERGAPLALKEVAEPDQNAVDKPEVTPA